MQELNKGLTRLRKIRNIIYKIRSFKFLKYSLLHLKYISHYLIKIYIDIRHLIFRVIFIVFINYFII